MNDGANKLSPTQASHLADFVAAYLDELGRQLARWGSASADYSAAAVMPMATRRALISAGWLEVVGRYESTTSQRKAFNFGRDARYTMTPVCNLTLAPSRKALDWYVSR